MRIIGKIIYGFFITLLVGVTGLFLSTMFPIPGNVEIKIVKSGSMEPAIQVGSVVVVKPQASYAVGDIITFGEDSSRQAPTTHRIVGIQNEGGSTIYTTKGDANEEADANSTSKGAVIGRVVVAVPYAGYVLDFARQPLGFALMIGIPATLIILEELFAITKEVRKIARRRRGKGDDDDEQGGSVREKVVYAKERVTDDIFVPMRLAIVERVHKPTTNSRAVVSLLVMGMIGSLTFSNASGITLSYFSDMEMSIGNVFQAGEWGPSADPFDIVLNEFLPNPDDEANGLNFGDDSDSKPLGEWIELYNNGDVDQDIAGWYMTDASGGVGNTHAVIGPSNTDTGSTIIPAHGWLVVYMNKPSLNNTGDEIYLYSPTDVLIDFVSYDDPSDACVLDPTPGDENSTSTPTGIPDNGPNADCVANQVAPNKSYARIPDGTGAWVDPVPTPGAPNIPDEEPTPQPPPDVSPEASEEDAPADEPEIVETSSGGGGESSAPEEEPIVEEEAPVEEASVEEENVEEVVVEEEVVEEEPTEEIVEDPVVEEPVVEEATPEEPVVEEVVESEPVIEEVVEPSPPPEPAEAEA